ncbi:hypothetical protein [Macrococcoides caseolyticum]|uniref:hypothetical protein n=1 Tax=Macrococcoides caseolyticum TaxID=69966 RepID=UPI001F20A097|nr:hypothetical protein [Macrococcus caseolyticus]MCE4958064.1 hypothetical protein [Macrococcus caseolyticus]
MNEEKSLEEINKEIEEQLLYEMENEHKFVEKKKKRAIFSAAGIIMLIIAARMLYNLFRPFF